MLRRPLRPVLASVLAVALSLGLQGCGAPMANSPRATLRAYADALAEGRADDAWAMLSEDTKKTITKERFREIVKHNREEALDIGKTLARDPGDPYVTAKIPLKNGDVITMVYEDGKWRVEGDALDFYSQATPRQAIVGFIRAFKKKRWDILVRYTPDAHKEGLSPERLQQAWGPDKPEGKQLGDRLAEIEQALPSAQIEETGDRATLVLSGSGGSVLFVREHGAWKVEDVR
ncbi:MAG: hypothetical protein HYV09_10700 [Deltaproteobacteria bacterium]|nr:hypothetical protein [Deltaproteobacteria bacterium]